MRPQELLVLVKIHRHELYPPERLIVRQRFENRFLGPANGTPAGINMHDYPPPGGQSLLERPRLIAVLRASPRGRCERGQDQGGTREQLTTRHGSASCVHQRQPTIAGRIPVSVRQVAVLRRTFLQTPPRDGALVLC